MPFQSLGRESINTSPHMRDYKTLCCIRVSFHARDRCTSPTATLILTPTRKQWDVQVYQWRNRSFVNIRRYVILSLSMGIVYNI